ncbi:MAG: hypothetical protein ACRESI_03430 [Gammaproteobacteria bacterium]
MWEMFAGSLAYIAAVYISVRLLPTYPTGGLHISLALVPLLPLVFIFWAVIRFVTHTDEMLRRLHIDALAISAGATAFLALTYGCLEMAGMPKLSAWWTFMCVDIIWAITVFILKRRYR